MSVLPDMIDDEEIQPYSVILSEEPQEDGSVLVKKREHVDGAILLRTYKREKRQEKVSKRIVERQSQWGHKEGSSEYHSSLEDRVYLEPPAAAMAQVELLKGQAESGSLICRFCGGPHLSLKCPDRARMLAEEEARRQKEEEDMYHRRFSHRDDTDEFRVRIYNFPPGEIDMEVVDDLLYPYHPTKVFKQRSMGAYASESSVVNVIFQNREDALKLLQARIIYGSAVLAPSWSKKDQEREKALKEKERNTI
ncbi:Translation initiation factor 3 subunit G domain-containing protein [Monocercomonoides exilis]|uniref:Translation initiation factor 3 subunit G domain-containing protein n=1 Tax=Monocercomonoides exilis TaxID=2049356 RepID=UPI0035597BAF|nr:Translation initiation factor 3 subunit G domain-containing protein [Monocercomonoides exilis]|eukprot:MONOS_10337.1-p1 / transcript=MONOS_10337.1 / gene=MONOS_10337 / organism=Monocercomonoides_exilis_PA203 / gene_product=Translation initiation factor 3 subunit G domain-containing protein / transcript_product=Translation initiation factor 3 subunit G domain-containing protein / location=Mono_scaffold00465:44495-45584(-) / protein_length=251 / sequence_SO=supercontig / SO=protein_coding / is_pseudo=false